VIHRSQGLIHLIEAEQCSPRPNPDLDGELHKIASILPRHIRYAAQLALTPEQRVIVKLRHPVQMNSVNRHNPALAQRSQRRQNHIAAGSKRNRPIQLHRRPFSSLANPNRTKLTRQILMRRTARSHVNLASPMLQNIDGQMRRSPKPKEPNPITRLNLGHPQTAKPDNPGTKQRSNILRGSLLRQRNTEISPSNRILRIPAIHRVAGKRRMIAKVLHPFAAEQTGSIRPAQPGNAKPLPGLDSRYASTSLLDTPHNLVSRSNRRKQWLQLTSSDMQIGPANPAGLHPKQNLARPRLRNRQIFKMKWILLNWRRAMKNSGSHEFDFNAEGLKAITRGLSS